MNSQQNQAVTSSSPVALRCGTSIIEALRSGAQGWVLLKPLCEQLGLNFSGQRQRLERQPWAVVCMMPMTGADRKTYEMYCLDASKVGMWLATLDTKRVKDAHAKAAIGELQVKASEVINQWLRSEQAPPAVPALRWTAEDPLEMFEYALQNMKRTRAELAQVAATQADHGARLALVENKQRLAAAEIEPVSPAQPELPAISKRRLIVEHVNRFAAAMNMGQHEVWRLLYHHVNRRLSISVYSYKLGPKETKLDRLESLGLLDKVGKVCDTDLQIPVERQRWLAAPISQAVQ